VFSHIEYRLILRHCNLCEEIVQLTSHSTVVIPDVSYTVMLINSQLTIVDLLKLIVIAVYKFLSSVMLILYEIY